MLGCYSTQQEGDSACITLTDADGIGVEYLWLYSPLR
jgi:hypothetical protein